MDKIAHLEGHIDRWSEEEEAIANARRRREENDEPNSE